MGFVDDFGTSYHLARDRARLARSGDASDSQVKKYAERSRFLDTGTHISASKCASVVLGYFVGNYTVFCPIQLQLDIFDGRVKSLLEEL